MQELTVSLASYVTYVRVEAAPEAVKSQADGNFKFKQTSWIIYWKSENVSTAQLTQQQ